jgi:hypothetical protein
MNKSKIILASVGGVALVASLALAYLIWSALSDKGEKASELEGALQTAERLARLPVYPGPEGIAAYKENAETYEAWREEAVKIAAAGDMTFETTTPPAFKALLADEARRLSSLPGAVEGHLVKPDFPFGFKEYITGGELPAQENLARLQREWYDVKTVVEALARSGVAEIVDVVVKSGAPVVKDEEQPKKGKKAKKPVKQQETAEAGPAVTRIEVEFRSSPAALVNVINEFIVSSRFVVIDQFSFAHERDDIAEALGGGDGKKQQEAAAGRGRRGRRGRTAEEEASQQEGEKASNIVTDPLSASLIKVNMSFSVYDFRSLEDGAAESQSAGEAKPEEEK